MTDEHDITEDELRNRISGNHMVHRLREWDDGDTLYGVESFQHDTGAATGKTYHEGGEYGEDTAEAKARNHFENPPPLAGGMVVVLYRATVQNPQTEPRNPMDPGEPPLKYANLISVEILEWKHTGDGGASDD